MIDMVGKKFSRLTVLSYAGRNKWAKPQDTWLCQCDCGNEVTVAGSALRSGNTRSCGCFQRERQIESRQLAKGRAGFNRLYREYVRSAKNKGHSFELTKEDLGFLTKMNCHYCGAEPKTVCYGDTERRRPHGTYIFNGIDRIDNSKGYTIDNVVACCKLCNYMKRSLDSQEFLEHVERIHDRRIRHGQVQRRN